MNRRSGPVPELSVIVPVYNEADNIAPLVAEVRDALEGKLEYEMIYVNDHSTDDSAAQLAELARGEPRLRVLTHRANYGQSTAMRSGVLAARAPWVAFLDGDGQNDPADIPKLWEMLHAPGRSAALCMVAGYRRKRRDNWLKRISSKIANGVRSRLLQDRTPDTGCGLKLVSRQAFLDLPYFDHMHRFLPALIQRDGGEVVSVVVNHRPRMRGVSKYGLHNRLWVGIIDMLGVWWLQKRGQTPRVDEERWS